MNKRNIFICFVLISGCSNQEYRQESGYSDIVLELGEKCAIMTEKLIAKGIDPLYSKSIWDRCMIVNGGTL